MFFAITTAAAFAASFFYGASIESLQLGVWLPRFFGGAAALTTLLHLREYLRGVR
ncbi:MAG: hypothetical protein UX98_C0022G0002 [Parcubacteria group bacterium GW2011_GWA2_47_26]|nr:MAG: hypothetical protein UX98_C0022G0002 [Parcubacteria group bacterium GW2011_GWA2_47_26]